MGGSYILIQLVGNGFEIISIIISNVLKWDRVILYSKGFHPAQKVYAGRVNMPTLLGMA